MKAVSLFPLAVGLIGFAIGRLSFGALSGIPRDHEPTVLSKRTSQGQARHQSKRVTSQNSGTSGRRIGIDHDLLVKMADWNDLDLSPLTIARILADIGEFSEQEILALLNNPSLAGNESDLIDHVKMSALIRWVELLGPEAFSDDEVNKSLAKSS